MPVCPVCNGLRELNFICSNCGNQMTESGRLMDYYDDYSPYMEIDLMKMEDGYKDTKSEHKCPHLYFCTNCQKDEVLFIKE